MIIIYNNTIIFFRLTIKTKTKLSHNNSNKIIILFNELTQIQLKIFKQVLKIKDSNNFNNNNNTTILIK